MIPCHGSIRLIHGASLVAVKLSMGYETWQPIGCVVPYVISWSNYISGNSSRVVSYGRTWVGISTGFQRPLTVTLQSSNGRQMPAERVVQWDYEIVCGSMAENQCESCFVSMRRYIGHRQGVLWGCESICIDALPRVKWVRGSDFKSNVK